MLLEAAKKIRQWFIGVCREAHPNLIAPMENDQLSIDLWPKNSKKSGVDSASESLFAAGACRVKTLDVTVQKQTLTVKEAEIQINWQSFVDRFKRLVAKHVPEATHMLWTERENGCWVVFEARSNRRAISSKLGACLAGCRVRIQERDGQLVVYLSDHFSFGAMSDPILVRVGELLARSLFGTELYPLLVQRKLANVFSWSMDVGQLAMMCWNQQALNAPQRQVFNEILFGHRVRTNHQSAKLSFDQYLPWIDNVKPHSVPIEVLESREMPDAYNLIEQNLLDASTRQNSIKRLHERFHEGDNFSFLHRRLMLCGDGSQRWRENDVKRFESGRGEGLLHLTFISQLHFNLGNIDVSRKLLTDVGDQLSKIIPEIDDLPVFDLVLPEYLGDVWADADYDVAMAAYERIFAKRGPIRSVLRKARELAESHHELEGEREVLVKLLAVERRSQDKGRILARLAHIARRQGDIDHALNLGRQAFHHGVLAIEHIDFLVETWLEHERFQEAVDFLQQLLDQKDLPYSPKDVERLQVTTGELWLDRLGRSELAERRFLLAMAIAPHSQRALDGLEAVYRMQDRPHLLKGIIEKKLEQALTANDQEKCDRLLVDYFTCLPTHEVDKNQLYWTTRLLQQGWLSAFNATRLLNLPKELNGWRDLIDATAACLKASDHSEQTQKNSLIALGDVARHALSDKKAAVFYLQATALGCLPRDRFELLFRVLEGSGDVGKIVELCKTALINRQDCNENDILEFLLHQYKMLNFEEHEQYIFWMLRVDSTITQHIDRFLERCRVERDISYLGEVFERLFASLKTDDQRILWLERMIAYLDVSESGQESVQLKAKLYKELNERSADPISVCMRAIQGLNDHPQHLGWFAERLLLMDAQPSLPDQLIQEVVLDPQALMVFYRQKLSRSPTQDEARRWLKKYEACAGPLGQLDESFLEKQLVRVLKVHSSCHPELLDRLRELVAKSGRWSVYTKVIEAHLDPLLKDRYRQLVLHLADVYDGSMQDAERSFRLLQKAIEQSPDDIDMLEAYVFYSFKVNTQDAAIKALVHYLQRRSAGTEAEDERVFALLVRLEAAGKAGQILEERLTRIEGAAKSSWVKRIRPLCQELGIWTEVLATDFFDEAVKNDSDELVEAAWNDLLAWFSQNAKLDTLLHVTRTALYESNRGERYLPLLAKLADRNDLQKLDYQSITSLFTGAGLELFEESDFHQSACHLLYRSFALNRDQKEVWIPLYLLLRKFEQVDKLEEVLSFVLPKVTKEPAILTAFPVTSESMEADYRRLTQGLPVLVPQSDSKNNASEQAIVLQNRHQRVAGDGVVIDYSHGEDFEETSSPRHLQLVDSESETSSLLNEVGSTSRTDEMVLDIEVGDWREHIVNLDLPKGITKAFANKAFANALEKHLVVQAMAILSGETQELLYAPWQVWRHVSDFEYPLSGRDRYASGSSSPLLSSPLRQYIGFLQPVLLHVYRHRFSLDFLATKLKVNPIDIINQRRPMRWEDGMLPEIGFPLYRDKLERQRFVIFDLGGLRKEIFYDGTQRALYFDRKYYASVPRTHLFHRVLGLLWAVNLQYFIPLTLKPDRHVMPVLIAIHRLGNEKGWQRIKRSLAGPRTRVEQALVKVDPDSLRLHLDQVGRIGLTQLTELWHAMQDHIYRLQLAETLDLVGLSEAILDIDLLEAHNLQKADILRMSPYIAKLIEYLTKLKL